MRKNCVLLALLPLLMSAGACVGTSKSANPLSPAIAGPIAGVGITAPTVVEPAIDALVNTTTQPITLKVSNAATTGVRPLSYMFEVATDPNFTNKVLAQGAVPQGEGITSFTLPTALAAERKYYWHARAEDGANTGPFGATSAFNVFTPIVFGSPTLVSPANGATTTTNQPRLVLANASRSGPVQAVYYFIELSTTAGFDPVIGSYTIPETSSQTALTVPVSLAGGQYFWRARASDLSNSGVFSAVFAFQTPAGGGGGGGGGPINGDWQTCGSTPGQELVGCVHAAVNPAHTVEGAFEVTKRVAWLLRGDGVGLLKKDGGENIVTWNGISFAAARIVYPNGHLFKILSDVPGTNGPGWADEGVDSGLINRWVAPMQP